MRSLLPGISLVLLVACGRPVEQAACPPVRPVVTPSAKVLEEVQESKPERVEFAGRTTEEWTERLEGYPFHVGRYRRGCIRPVDTEALEASRFSELRDAGAEAHSVLLDLLECGPHHGAAEAARDALVEHARRDPEQIVDLLGAALTSPSSYFRENALAVLVRIGGPRVVEVLAAHLDADPHLARLAAGSLKKLAALGRPAVPRLLVAMERGDEKLCSAAGRALKEIGGEAVARGLLRILDRSPVESVRDEAALGLLGRSVPLEAFGGELLEALRHPSADVRWHAAGLLGKGDVRGGEFRRGLVDAMEDVDPRVCLAAAYSLTELEEPAPEVVAAMIPLLRHSDSEVRLEAASLIWAQGVAGAAAVRELVTAVSDGHEDVRRQAALALGSVGEGRPEATTVLLDALPREPAILVRLAMVDALGRLRDDRTLPVLVQALADADDDVRARAAVRLGGWGVDVRQAVPAILSSLEKESDWGARESLTEALGRIGGDRAMGALIDLLTGEEHIHQDDAAEALGLMGQAASAAVPHLERALVDVRTYVAESAASALAAIGGPDALGALLRGLREEDCEVRARCATALGEIGTPEAVEALRRCLRDENPKVRISAEGALNAIRGGAAR